MNALYNIMEHWKNLTCYQSLWSICLGYVVAVHQLTVDYLFFCLFVLWSSSTNRDFLLLTNSEKCSDLY